jgi:bifunctional non-homologous end joining protein LigD
MPAAVDGVDIPGEDGAVERHLCVRNREGLLGLVQMNVLEFHPWGAPAGAPESPDRLIFDLDPGAGVSWKSMVEAAVMVRDAIAQAKLRGFARVSGGKGVHIVVPLRPGHTWEQAKTFSKAAAEALVKLAPRRFVATPGAPNREGRIFIDYLRNARGATAIASYSTRARPGAPVALPVAWDELEGLESAHAFSVPAVLRRLAAAPPDPWRGMGSAGGVLPNRPRP